MIDTAVKVLEKIILNRMLRYTDGVNSLSNNHFCFRKERSTVDAVLSVAKTAKIALSVRRRGFATVQ